MSECPITPLLVTNCIVHRPDYVAKAFRAGGEMPWFTTDGRLRFHRRFLLLLVLDSRS